MSKEQNRTFKPLRRDKEHPENASKVGIVAPSYARPATSPALVKDRQDTIDSYIEATCESVRKLGFDPVFPDDSIDPPIDNCGWSNTAEERARAIINMLNNPEIEAMWQVSGGDSALDVVTILNDYDNAPKATEQRITDAWKKSHPDQQLSVQL